MIRHKAVTQQVPELLGHLARLIRVAVEPKGALRTAKEGGVDAAVLDKLPILIGKLTLFVGFTAGCAI